MEHAPIKATSRRRRRAFKLAASFVALTTTLVLATSSVASSTTTLTLGGQGMFSGVARMSRATPYYAIPNSDPCRTEGGTPMVWDGSNSLSGSNMPGNFGAGSVTLAGSATLAALDDPRTLPWGQSASATVDTMQASVTSSAGSASISFGPGTYANGQCIDWDHVDLSSIFTSDPIPTDPYLQWSDTTGWWRQIAVNRPFIAVIQPAVGAGVIERGISSFSCFERQNWWGPISSGSGLWGSGSTEACGLYFYVDTREPADDVAPSVSGTPDRGANAAGWYNADVTVDWQAADPDPSSGTPSDPPNTLASTEGANITYTSAQSCDPANNCAIGSIQLSIDKTDPTVATPALSVNPKAVTESTTLSAASNDSLSGVAGGEYYLGTDPGEGNGTAMAHGGGTLSATVGNSLSPGVYPVCVRARDAADNWSTPSCVYLVVYDPSAGFATGGGWFVPGGNTSDPGDLLPGLDGTSKANFGFVVRYQNGASAQPGGQLEFHYNVGKFHLHSTGMEWLVVTNNNWAKFSGTARIDGASGNYPFRVDARDDSVDRFIIKIWAPGANPDTDSPIYKASGDVEGGQVKIHRS